MRTTISQRPPKMRTTVSIIYLSTRSSSVPPNTAVAGSGVCEKKPARRMMHSGTPPPIPRKQCWCFADERGRQQKRSFLSHAWNTTRRSNIEHKGEWGATLTQQQHCRTAFFFALPGIRSLNNSIAKGPCVIVQRLTRLLSSDVVKHGTSDTSDTKT